MKQEEFSKLIETLAHALEWLWWKVVGHNLLSQIFMMGCGVCGFFGGLLTAIGDQYENGHIDHGNTHAGHIGLYIAAVCLIAAWTNRLVEWLRTDAKQKFHNYIRGGEEDLGEAPEDQADGYSEPRG